MPEKQCTAYDSLRTVHKGNKAVIKEELNEIVNNSQDEQPMIKATCHFRKCLAIKHVLKLLCAVAKHSKEKLLKSIEDDLRDSKNRELPW